MFAYQSFLTSLFLIAALIALTAGILFFIRFQTKLTGWAGVFSLAMASDLVCYYLILTSTTPDLMRFWFQVLIITYLFLSINWLFFVALFTGHTQWVNSRIVIVAGVVPILLSGILLLTLPGIDPVWMGTIGSATGWTGGFGLFGDLFALYIFSIDLISMSLLIRMIWNNHPYFRNLALLLGAGTLMVIVAGLSELTGNNPFAPFSIVQIFKVVHSVIAFVGVFIFRGGHVLPVARDAIFAHLQDGLMVFDRNDNLVDLNPVAVKILGQSEEAVIGQPVSQVWEQGAAFLAKYPDVSMVEDKHTLLVDGQEQTFDITISPVLDANRDGIGRVILLRNVTNRERMERTLQERTRELTRTNKLVTALSSVAAHLSSFPDANFDFDILGAEMRSLGLDCAIASLDPDGEAARITYLSFNPMLVREVEKLTGLVAKDYVIPKSNWTDNRLMWERKPVWYSDLMSILTEMFPHISSPLIKKSLQLLGFKPDTQLCILPLINRERIFGIMSIWGTDLRPSDSMILDIFSNQVSSILQNALSYETEVRRTNELARSNAMILSLAKVAALLGNRLNSDLILDTLGSELQKLKLDCGIAVIDPAGEKATIKYMSFSSTLLQRIEKNTGFSLKNHVIPKRYWPGDRILKEKIPIWYPNPRNILKQLFPHVPDALRDRGFQLLGIPPGGQICIIPLRIGEKLIGAMTIWGDDLNQADDPILAIFASQVASILENADAYETETRRAEELARSNSIIMTLSKVAAQLESSSDSDVIFETVGTELKKMGLASMVGVLDDNKQNLQIRYISANRDIIHRGEKMIGRQISELTIPRRLWPTQKVVDEKATYWSSMKSTLNIFPGIPENLYRTILKMAGINLEDPVCYLPIATEYEVIGVLSVWGTGLNKNDAPALSIIANQVGATIRNSRLYEMESRRARELDILLKASEATSSSSDLDQVLLRLASQLLDISGFESCYISEWNKETNLIHSRIDHSRVFWIEEKREAYSLSDYPRTKGVLLTGRSVILQGDFEAEEKQWMEQLGRTAVIILALYAREKVIGLVEIATMKKNKLFSLEELRSCEEIIKDAADSFPEPLCAMEPKALFALQKTLVRESGGEICSFSEWDQGQNRILTCTVYADQVWEPGQSPGIEPDRDTLWKLALQEGKSSAWARSDVEKIESTNGTYMDVESVILFPLQKGGQPIGLVELYDFNNKRQVSAEQIALLRTIADKASYSIENARLLQQTKERLDEQTELLHEKEVLLKEIHHRVKNNLQVISSLLNLQAGKVADDRTKQLLGESQARVRSMALIHEKLYQSESLAKINLADYVKSLTRELFYTYRRGLNDIDLVILAEEIALPLDQAVPCGLILNELITNALKYAFPEDKNGALRVELRSNPDHVLTLRVADDGMGMPTDFDYRKANSLGLQLINSLVAQLDGQLELDRSAGTDFRISFKY